MIEGAEDKIKALLATKKVYQPMFMCPNGSRVERFCKNKDCKQLALICQQNNCIQCELRHISCEFIDLTNFTKEVNAKWQDNSKMITGFYLEEIKLLNQFIQSWKEVIDGSFTFGLDGEYLKILNSIYFIPLTAAAPPKLVGAEMEKFHRAIELNLKQELQWQPMLDSYRKSIQAYLKNLKDMRKSNVVDKANLSLQPPGIVKPPTTLPLQPKSSQLLSKILKKEINADKEKIDFILK